MKLYSRKEVRCIVEDFLAEYLNLDSVSLKERSIRNLIEICNNYGIEVEDIKENME